MREMLISGGELLVVGMGIVFLFLAMLILAVNSMSKLIARFIDGPVTVAANAQPSTLPAHGNTDPAVIAAISSAVHQYRQQHPQSS